MYIPRLLTKLVSDLTVIAIYFITQSTNKRSLLTFEKCHMNTATKTGIAYDYSSFGMRVSIGTRHVYELDQRHILTQSSGAV